jgi:hypothetical protein
VGVGNPAEETYCYPNNEILCPPPFLSTPYTIKLITLMLLPRMTNSLNRLRVLPLQTRTIFKQETFSPPPIRSPKCSRIDPGTRPTRKRDSPSPPRGRGLG